MLKKLLKYDLRSMLRLWWIGAMVSLIMGVAGGFCWMLVAGDRPIPTAVETICVILIALAVIYFVALAVFTTVIIFIRFFRNFFSDEGYLTFTLPVHRHTLLNSKIISGLVLSLGSVLVIALSASVMACIGAHEYIFSAEFWEDAKIFFANIYRELGGYLWIYLAEGLALYLLAQLISLVFLYLCIGFGSTVAKRAKLVASIGIYYAASSGCTFILQLLVIFCFPNLGYWMSSLDQPQALMLVALMLLCAVLFMAALTALLYSLLNRMLARKLNLS